MRLLLKLVAVIVLGPIALVLILLAAVAAIVGIPLLWEQFVSKWTAPPPQTGQT